MVSVSGGYLTPPLWAKLQLTCVEQHIEVPSLPAMGGINSSAEALYPYPIHRL